MALSELRIHQYRSVGTLEFPVKRATILLGPNGCGKTNVYRALELLQAAAAGHLAATFAREGGFMSALHAQADECVIRLGLTTGEFTYDIEIKNHVEAFSPFLLDPLVSREIITMANGKRKSVLLDRTASTCYVVNRDGVREQFLLEFDPNESVLSQLVESHQYPIIDDFRRRLSKWRFYHSFRSDVDSPIRQPQRASRTPVMASDGTDVAAALMTILHHSGNDLNLKKAISDAFGGAELAIDHSGGFMLGLNESGRHTRAHELSDGTLRYLCLLAALYSVRPPELLIFNEPETSLHPNLLPKLGALIAEASERSQILVTTHAQVIAEKVQERVGCSPIALEKVSGQTMRAGRTAKVYYKAEDWE